MSMSFILLFLVTVFLSFLGTWMMRKIALRHSVLDIPNHRSSHEFPTPRGGGIALILSFYLSAGYFLLTSPQPIPGNCLGLGFCGLCIALVGLWDDLLGLPAGKRLLAHFFIVFLTVYFFTPYELLQLGVTGSGFPSIYLFCLAVVGIVWLLNLYNFMDGIDGLAAGEAVSAAAGAALILIFSGEQAGYPQLFLLVVASALGFLWWNWPPARIFMGDAGSGFLGFCFGISALLTIIGTAMTIWTWLLLLAVFVVDATTTLCVRIGRGEKFYLAHRSHAYQILARRMGSHLKATLCYLAINWLFLIPAAWLSVFRPEYGLVLTIFSYAALTIFCIVVGAGKTND